MSGQRPVVRLVSEVGVQFGHLDRAAGAEAVAKHVRMFWDPRMRAELLGLSEGELAELDEPARAAVTVLRAD